MQNNTERAQNIWREWASHRLKQLSEEERDCGFKLDSDTIKMATLSVNYWLQRFILKVRKANGALIVCIRFVMV